MGLDKIRQEIDQIDVQLKDLFLKRMELSGQVIEEKKQTGGAVYAPKREQEILELRSSGVEAEYVPECQAFFKQIMGISRTYQYSKMAEQAEALANLPAGEGEAELQFFCETGSGQPVVFLEAAVLAGLKPEKITTEEKQEGENICRIRLSGDFSGELAKAAVLQVLEEGTSAMITYTTTF